MSHAMNEPSTSTSTPGASGDGVPRVATSRAYAEPKQQRSIGELIASIRDEVTGVIKTQVDIAKKELIALGTKIGIIAAFGAVMLFLLLTAWVMFLFFAASGLHALGLAWWASFLIITGVFVVVALIAGLIAFFMLKKLLKAQEEDPVLGVTIETSEGALNALQGKRHHSGADYEDAFADLYGKRVSSRTE